MSLIKAVYDALRNHDVAAVGGMMSPDFEAHIAPGMPYGVGGAHYGAKAMLTDVWGVIGKHFDVAPYEESIDTTIGGLTVVTGRYRGTDRSTGRAFEAEFVHLWRIDGTRFSGIRQYTDTARWNEATVGGRGTDGPAAGRA